jgi:hypothetical protein
MLSVPNMGGRFDALVLPLTTRNHVISASHILLSLFGDNLAIGLFVECLGVVGIRVKGLVSGVEDFASEGVASSTNAFEARLDIVDEFRHVGLDLFAILHEVTFAPGNTAAMAKSYFYSRETSSPLKRTTSGVTSITSSIPYGIHCE